MSPRSDEEREAARREREARRAARDARQAAREGRSVPAVPATPAPAPPAPPAAVTDDLGGPGTPQSISGGPVYDPGERPLGMRRVTAAQRESRSAPLDLASPGGYSEPPGPGAPRARPGRPRPGRGGPRPPGRLIGAAAGLAVLVAAAWLLFSLFQPFKGAGSGAVTVRIPPGATAGQVGDLLERQGVVASSRFFSLRARVDGKRDALKAGTFTLRRDMSYSAALGVLTKAPPAPRTIRLTIPEGRSREEVAPTVRAAGLSGDYLAETDRSAVLSPRRYGAPKGTRTLEGFLFPATYELKPGAKARTLVTQQLEAFKAAIARVDLRAAKRRNLTVYDIVTIASMIEREAGIPRDRRLVAAVIYNRLKLGMPLGIDATIRYERRNWTRPLRVSELQADTPFNTRKRVGLPPTPIGSPGLAVLEAAAHPAKVGYLYYVVKPCGRGASSFSSTDAQFQRDVAAYNRARERAGGKSPVNC